MPAEAVKVKRIWDTDCNGNFGSYEIPGDPVMGTPTIIRCTCDHVACGTCPTVAAGIQLDPTDNMVFNQLFDDSDQAIANGQSSGSITINYQVAGEEFVRVYKVEWILNALNQYEQTVTRTDQPVSVE